MMKKLTKLQASAKHVVFAQRLSACLKVRQVPATPIALSAALNKHCKTTAFKAHTVRKWLLGITQPRSEALLQLASFLDVDPKDLISELSKTPPSNKVSFEFDFTDQEVITKYLAMTVKQKVTVRLLIDAIADKSR